MLRAANNKLIERKYYINIVNEQDSIINFQKEYINEQSEIISDMQNRIMETNRINQKLQEQYDRQRHKTMVCSTVLSTVLVGALVGTVAYIAIK